MNCLVCGHKLATFRKLSLGDFCCQEHRTLFLKEQNERGMKRLVDWDRGPKSRMAGTRVYAQFLPEEVAARQHAASCRGYGLLPPVRMSSSELPPQVIPQLAAGRPANL